MRAFCHVAWVVAVKVTWYFKQSFSFIMFYNNWRYFELSSLNHAAALPLFGPKGLPDKQKTKIVLRKHSKLCYLYKSIFCRYKIGFDIKHVPQHSVKFFSHAFCLGHFLFRSLQRKERGVARAMSKHHSLYLHILFT